MFSVYRYGNVYLFDDHVKTPLLARSLRCQVRRTYVRQSSLGTPSLPSHAKAADDVRFTMNQKLAWGFHRRVQATCHFRACTRFRGTTERTSTCSSPALLLSLSRVSGKDGKSGLHATGKGSVIVFTVTPLFIRNVLALGLGDLCEMHVHVRLNLLAASRQLSHKKAITLLTSPHNL